MQLDRRVAALEARTAPCRPARCADCGHEHADVALSLERLQDAHAGRHVEPSAVCACRCCAPMLEELAARHLAAGEPSMSTLGKRLNALEQLAEAVRVSDLRRQLEDDARVANMRPDLIAGHVDRLLAIERTVQAWLAAGMSRDEIARQCAIEVGADPETFAEHVAAACERERRCVA